MTEVHVRPFFRKKSFRQALGGVSETLFDEWRANGEIPPPDGWLSERIPFWTSQTVQSTQERFLNRPRPIERRARRRAADDLETV